MKNVIEDDYIILDNENDDEKKIELEQRKNKSKTKINDINEPLDLCFLVDCTCMTQFTNIT